MSFNKRYISQNKLEKISNQYDYISFFNFFNSDSLISEDKFSSNIINEISKYKIEDKEEIIKIMKKCKGE